MKKIVFQEAVWADRQLVPLKISVPEYVNNCRAAGKRPILYRIGTMQYCKHGEVCYRPSSPVRQSLAKSKGSFFPIVFLRTGSSAYLKMEITLSLGAALRSLYQNWPRNFNDKINWEICGSGMRKTKLSEEILLAWGGMKNRITL